MNVLVTGAGGGVGQGIIKALRLIPDLDITIISADMSSLASGLYSGDVSRIVPAASSSDYLEKLGTLFEEENVDYYFAGTDVELLFCAKNRHEIFERFGVKTVVSPLYAINIADDKYKTYQFLKQNDFYYPKTFRADDVDLNSLEYPVIVKPAVGCRSIGVGIANNPSAVKARIEKESNLVIQELIGTDKTEYTCTVVVKDGLASEVLALRRDLRAGDTFRAYPVNHPAITTYVKEVAIALGVEGPCNFQLRLDEKNIPKIFEINCRFSGTTPFCAQLGFNPVEYYLKKDIGLNYIFKINYDAAVLRYWSEVVVPIDKINTVEQEGRVIPETLQNAPLFTKD